MNPEEAATSKKIKTLTEKISPINLNNKPEDFFFKFKNITKIILSYLEVKELFRVSRCNKYLFFEVHEPKNDYFKVQFYRLLKKKIMVLPTEIDHNDYKKLSSTVLILTSPEYGLYASLSESYLEDSFVDVVAKSDLERRKILLPPGEFKGTNIFNTCHIIGLDHLREREREEDKYKQLKKASVISGEFVIGADCKFENVRFELVGESQETLEKRSMICDSCKPIFEDCQFFGNSKTMFLTNNTCIFIRCSLTNSYGYCVVIYESARPVTIENCNFFNTKCAMNFTEAGSIYISGSSFKNCETGIEWIEINQSNKSIEIVNSNFEECGEGIYLSGGHSKITGNTFKKNKTGIFKKISGTSSITKNTFVENNISVKLRVGITNIENDNTFEKNKEDVLNSKLDNLSVDLESKYKGVDKELIDCLEKGLCTYLETKTHHTNQEGFVCDTCNLGEFAMLCTTCAKVCHEGHNIRFDKIAQGFCDCQDMCSFCKFKDHDKKII